MGRWGIRECSISRGGPDCTVGVCMSEESEEGVTVLRQRGTSKSSEFGEGKL